eukprot:4700034-Pyramimonas_sp.AAC.2
MTICACSLGALLLETARQAVPPRRTGVLQNFPTHPIVLGGPGGPSGPGMPLAAAHITTKVSCLAHRVDVIPPEP